MKTFYHAPESGRENSPVLPLRTKSKSVSASGSNTFFAALLICFAIDVRGQQTDTTIFINVSSHKDTVMHIVWDRIQGGEIYTIEKSTNGKIFFSLAEIRTDALIDLMQLEESAMKAFGSILYSTEGGYARFIYNDIQAETKSIDYRIRVSKGNGDIIYSRSAHLYEDGSDTLGLHDFLQSLSASADRSLCPPIGTPPSASCIVATNIYITQYINCCTVTLRRYDPMNCSLNFFCMDCICACSCTTDPCCVHMCSQYVFCTCTPWDPCGTAGQPIWVVVNSVPGAPAPSLSATSFQVCTGQSATLYASGASTYTWSPSSTLSSSTGSSVIATPSATTTYTVTGYLNGCTATAQITITVNPFPVVTVSPAATICAGQSTILMASGANTYSWSPSSTLNSSTGWSVIATPFSTSTYTVTGNLNGCTATAQTTITVNPAPAVTVSPPAAICTGQSVTLIASGAATYSWSPSASLSSSAGSSVVATPSSTTTYTVTGYLNGCTSTAQTTITVNPVPAVTVSPPVTICTGQSITLVASGANTYSWTPSASLNSSTGSTVTAAPSSTTTYTVTGDLSGCTATAQTTVTVNSLPAVTISPAVTICAGQSTILMASGANTYSWTPSASLNSSTGSNVTATPFSTTTYTVTGDLNGCTATAQTTVTVNPLPVITVSPATTICAGQSTTLFASGANTYSWIPSASLNSSTGSNVTATPLSTTTYTVTGNLNGCTSTAQTTVTVNPLPVITISPAATICAGQSITLIAGGANTYVWNPSSTLNLSTGSTVIASPVSTTTYNVTGNLNGCTATAQTTVVVNPLPAVLVSPGDTICVGQSIMLVASGANTYSWSPSASLNSSTGSGVTATPSATTTYTVTGDLSGCTSTAQTTITVSPFPAVTISPAVTICAGQSTILIASGANTYSWSPSVSLNSSTGSNVVATPFSTTTYTVTGDLNGCTSTAQTTVTVNPLPVITVSPAATVCAGQSATLFAGGANAYSWSPSASLSSSAGSSVVAMPSSTTTYTVTGYLSGCTSTAQVTVSVNPLPSAIFTLDPATGCSPLDVQFTDASVTTLGSSYLWSFGDNSTSVLENPNHTFLLAGTFIITLTITSPAGCINSAASAVTVYPVPVAQYTATPLSAETGTKIYFTDQSYSNIVSWSWDFGDGKGVSSIQNPDYAYDSVDNFISQLIVSNIYGCVDTANSTLVITEGIFEIWIPNVFTPNDDQKNDVFNARGMRITKLDMSIFDRWGMEIFHTMDKEQGWNGRMNGGGVECLMDTYVYLIKAWDDKNKARHFTGHITLLR